MVTVEGFDPKMIANNLTPFCATHPGMVVRDELDYLKISADEAAERMGADKQLVKDVLDEKAPMTSELALMFEALIGVPSEDLMHFQMEFDMLTAKKNQGFMKKLENIRRIAAVF